VSDSLPTWERDLFEATTNKAFLFYVVFGELDNSVACSRSTYQTEGLPAGLEMSAYNAERDRDVLDGFRQGYLWDQLNLTNRALANEVAACEHCLILRGELDDKPTLNDLRDTVGLLTFLLDQGGVAVFDPQMFEWWTPAAWRKRVFEPHQPKLNAHVVTLVSEEDDPNVFWFHTRGMRKFARPDISVHGVPADLRDDVVELCNRFLHMQFHGAVIPEGQEIRMANLPPAIVRHGGHVDNPEFNNVHFEIVWS